MAPKHRVEIELFDKDAPNWRVGCTCGVRLDGFGSVGLAEQAIERYHEAKGWTINKIKVKGN